MKRAQEESSQWSNLLRGNSQLLVLAVLRDGPKHGYAIAQEIRRRSGEELPFRQGTLYPLLHEMERDGFIASDWQITDAERPRRVYRLTLRGEAEYERLLARWKRFSAAVARLTGIDHAGDPSTETSGP